MLNTLELKNAQIAQLGNHNPLASQRQANWSTLIAQRVSGLLDASRPKMSVLVRPRNRKRETVRAPRQKVDEKLPRHTEKPGAHLPTFAHRFLLKCGRMSRPASSVIHPERAEYLSSVEYSGGGSRADNTPNGTYIKDMNERDKL